MKKTISILLIILGTVYSCQKPPVYPDVPYINYENYYLYIDTNELDQAILISKINFYFTDGDGNVGFDPLPDSIASGYPDSLRYNLFFQLYNYQDGAFVQVPEEDGGFLKYIIPYLDKQPLSGTIAVSIEYPIIKYDTIFYTFYLYDRDLNRSNTDTTDIMILSGIDL